ncbi:unnamed protein product, partial [Lymnaea stagnalis]
MSNTLRIVSLMLLAFTIQSVSTQTCKKTADVVLAVDISFSITTGNFHDYVLPFLQSVVAEFDIGPNESQVQVGAVTFSDKVRLAFRLSDHRDEDSLLRAVGDIYYAGGETYTDAALKYVRDNMFTWANGGRDDAERIVIVLTDGRSFSRPRTVAQAEACRHQGIVLFAVGVGSADVRELEEIGNAPADEHVFYVTDFNALDSIRASLTDNACGGDKSDPVLNDDRSSFTPCQGSAADVIFVIDQSSSIGARRFYADVIPFLQSVISDLDIGPDDTQVHVGAVLFGTTATAPFFLGDHRFKDDLLRAVSDIRYAGGGTNLHQALKLVNDAMFRLENGARTDASKIVVLLTDGRANNRVQAVQQARAARENGVQIFALGV